MSYTSQEDHQKAIKRIESLEKDVQILKENLKENSRKRGDKKRKNPPKNCDPAPEVTSNQSCMMSATWTTLCVVLLSVISLVIYGMIPKVGPPFFVDVAIQSEPPVVIDYDHLGLPVYKDLAGKKCVVTGANGFFGTNLVGMLLEEGWDVVALHRDASDLTSLKDVERLATKGTLEYRSVSLLDVESLRNAIDDDVDVVFHVAAVLPAGIWSNDQVYNVNVNGTRNVVDVCLEKNVGKLIFTSSISAYRGLQFKDGEVLNETWPQSGRYSWNAYSYSKYFAEQEVLKGVNRGLFAVILNPAGIIGKYDQGGYARFVNIIEERSIPAVCDGYMISNSVNEIAKAHIAAAKKGRLGERYLLTGTPMKTADYMMTMAELMGDKEFTIKTVPTPIITFIGKIGELYNYVTGNVPKITPEIGLTICSGNFQSDNSKAMEELDYKLGDLKAAMKDSLEWIRSQNK
eukprot:TRINITY_DN10484_c0_g1_i1.p1 TRINITY_DN10484_c0_g1~~TRINITY_DN10484_c0_g1_i1.p1  ORF type:complete len:459 (-),score=120.91 TRINITY_DN10484_c0_g1_i1:16-1392(-)